MAVNGVVNVQEKKIDITQSISYKNTTSDTLTESYLNDWIHSYSNKSTALAKRFEEEFNTKFHLAKKEQRGFTFINSINDDGNNALSFERLENQVDVIKIKLVEPLLPNASYNIELDYYFQCYLCPYN